MRKGTLADISGELPKTIQASIIYRLWVLHDEPDRYKAFVELIEEALDWIAQELAHNPELQQGQSEDQLTGHVIRMLRAMTFEAGHDEKIGGHCDILVKAHGNMLWLGEAKKIEKTDNSRLFDGFRQLTTRYATGGVNEDAGGIIIYCYAPRLADIMEKWKDYLEERINGITIDYCPRNPYALRSRHILRRTGRDYRIRHLPVSLWFDPQDRR